MAGKEIEAIFFLNSRMVMCDKDDLDRTFKSIYYDNENHELVELDEGEMGHG